MHFTNRSPLNSLNILQNILNALILVNVTKARFIRRISAVSNAIETIDNEMICLIIFCLNCIRHGRNATYEPGLSKQTSRPFSERCFHVWRTLPEGHFRRKLKRKVLLSLQPCVHWIPIPC